MSQIRRRLPVTGRHGSSRVSRVVSRVACHETPANIGLSRCHRYFTPRGTPTHPGCPHHQPRRAASGYRSRLAHLGTLWYACGTVPPACFRPALYPVVAASRQSAAPFDQSLGLKHPQAHRLVRLRHTRRYGYWYGSKPHQHPVNIGLARLHGSKHPLHLRPSSRRP